MPERRFTELQPKDGDCIVHCGHMDVKTHHFFKVEGVGVTCPDGTNIKPQWLVLCQNCFASGRDPLTCICGDGTWMGDEPIITEGVQ